MSDNRNDKTKGSQNEYSGQNRLQPPTNIAEPPADNQEGKTNAPASGDTQTSTSS